MEFLESFVAFTNDILMVICSDCDAGRSGDLVFIADTICTGALPEGNGTSFEGRRWTED